MLTSEHDRDWGHALQVLRALCSGTITVGITLHTDCLTPLLSVPPGADTIPGTRQVFNTVDS